MIEKYKALKEASSSLEFFANRQPLCPHCGREIDIAKHDLYRLYEEGEHDGIECPYCELEFAVSTRISHSFSTENQDDHD